MTAQAAWRARDDDIEEGMGKSSGGRADGAALNCPVTLLGRRSIVHGFGYTPRLPCQPWTPRLMPLL